MVHRAAGLSHAGCDTLPLQQNDKVHRPIRHICPLLASWSNVRWDYYWCRLHPAKFSETNAGIAAVYNRDEN